MVGEPNVEDTISILRGLKERYEVHHGVRIKDSAIVAAATLSHRYINDRFLPDKAIDLIDEAASHLRMEIDSVPGEIDAVDRKIIQLEIERQALTKEKDSASRERLERIEKELADLKENSSQLRARWENEVEVIKRIRTIKEQIEEARLAEQEAQRAGDLERAAELRYGTLTRLERELEEANAAMDKVEASSRMLKEEVDEEDVAEVVSKWAGIPVSKLMESEVEKLLHMEALLRKRVVGQDEAIKSVSNALRRARARLQDPNRPIGSFIFLGPTGVGKTELAKALAEFMFDDEQAMTRIDMSEFMEKHSVSRLIGAPPGYVGYEEGGYLTEAVRRRPYTVILLDEVEKAHHDVFNILLQIMDDGRLTDGHGRTVDFKNAILIMTSNIGSQHIQDLGDEDYDKMQLRVTEAMKSHFRPEFLNRVDDTIIFHTLRKEVLRDIVYIQVERLKERLAESKIDITLTPAAEELLIEVGYDPVYGARPLKRALQRLILDPLALKLLEGEIMEGQEVEVDAEGGKMVFRHTAIPKS
jgi:ATP-dependent Clp protease ATP-binding subunit ClpB